MLEPFTLEQAVWYAEKGWRLVLRMRAVPERTVENWPIWDALWDELQWFNSLRHRDILEAE